LPKSFLNRFSKVFLRELEPSDSVLILERSIQVDKDQEAVHLWTEVQLNRLVSLASELSCHGSSMSPPEYGPGTPFEFNLRDIGRLRQVVSCIRTKLSWNTTGEQITEEGWNHFAFRLAVLLTFSCRFRTPSGRNVVDAAFRAKFGFSILSENTFKVSRALGHLSRVAGAP